jgi:hypothetical protein
MCILTQNSQVIKVFHPQNAQDEVRFSDEKGRDKVQLKGRVK